MVQIGSENDESDCRSSSRIRRKSIGLSGSAARERLVSECSSFDGMEDMVPLEIDDLQSFQKREQSKDEVDKSRLVESRLIRRKIRVNHSDDGPIMVAEANPFFTMTMQMKKKMLGSGNSDMTASQRARMNWKKALRKLSERVDVWATFHWDEVFIENATRYRYNPLTKKWNEEKVLVKIEAQPFGKGAMRECYRMKKLSNFSHSQDWNRDSNNYVAKCYIEEVPRDTYFQDVKLQMEAKLWGEEYNRHKPPKKVDIFMMAVLEFHERQGKPLFHVEHFIDGEYIKYNSNSGFVEDSVCRKTPHAFSHFTFERSGHELIVVDVQGVGDLYTDPQIHTADGIGYGDGNLGTRGMALFFHSHVCNDICQSLGLSKFDLANSEKDERTQALKRTRTPSETIIKSSNEILFCESPSATLKTDFCEFFRHRAMSNSGNGVLGLDLAAARSHAKAVAAGNRRTRTYSDYYSMEEVSSPTSAPIILEGKELNFHSSDSACSDGSNLQLNGGFKERERRMTESSDDSGIVTTRDVLTFHEVVRNMAKPSNVQGQEREDLVHNDSILGQVHFDLAKYHELGKFAEEGKTFDNGAAFFHLRCAADCGLLTAIIALSKIYLDIPHDVLEEVKVPEKNPEKKTRLGLRYMEEAAKAGDRSSMVFIARSYDNGYNLMEKSAKKAVDWYEKICERDEVEGDDDCSMDDATYKLLARQAELWLAGDDDLEKDATRAGDLYNQAAEAAMASMKGKLANKYYMLAEEAYAQCEDEE